MRHSSLNVLTNNRAIRLYNNDEISVGNFIEATHVIYPVPESTELITRFATHMHTNNRFYTDDNGFEMLERIYDPTIKLSIPGNYYPTIYQSYITDGSNSFSVCHIFRSVSQS